MKINILVLNLFFIFFPSQKLKMAWILWRYKRAKDKKLPQIMVFDLLSL